MRDRPHVRSAAIVGAGTMGAGIAMTFANAGIAVWLADASADALVRARATIAETYAAAVARGRMTRDVANERVAAIETTHELEVLRDVDVAIEAVVEDLAIKREVFAQFGHFCRPETLLATNTSTLDVDAIAASAPHPERTLGMHFFSPAHVMKLVEIVRGARTSQESLAAAVAIGERLGKTPVVVGNCDGFVGNRMLLGYRREAEFLLLAGATPERVDAALREFGFAMGPFAVSDLAGIDVGYRAKCERIKRGAASAFALTDLTDSLVAAGRLGQKVGRGYYRYAPGDRSPQPDPAIASFVAAERERLHVRAGSVTDETIVERCIYALVCEGAIVLEEGIAATAADIDTIWTAGYGFPKARGGPMAFAQAIGVDRVLHTIRGYAERDPAFWRVSPALVEAAARGRFA